MPEPTVIGDIIGMLNARIRSGEPVHSGGFVYVFTPAGVVSYTELEYERLKYGRNDSHTDE